MSTLPFNVDFSIPAKVTGRAPFIIPEDDFISGTNRVSARAAREINQAARALQVTTTKKAAAKAAKAAGDKTFIHPCKVHGAGKHYASNSFCVECSREYQKQYREDNPEYQKQYREENREYFRQYREENREYFRQYREDNPECFKRYYESNRSFYLAMTTCQRMGLSQKGLKQRLPYSEQQFIEHIESLWLDGMSWENYGNGKDCWSVDHKIPISHFIKTGEKGIAVINALSNLQPLWHSDNVKKGNSLPDGFH
ncbi:hypothetical protein U4W14_13185 [Enterobacter hormaechei]|uniref:hypothetical protein n=1 Tax=Enterobacter hormaechei TaxID=158836 RepID=UPI003088B3D9|nr:hypothetical protein U4W14_13185 [Enterobacter hormaechei]